MESIETMLIKSPQREYIKLLDHEVIRVISPRLIRITLSDIEKNAAVQKMIDEQDNGLRVNLHNRGHVEQVEGIGTKIFMGLGYSENDRIVEDYKIAALLHDIGNSKGRENHAENGAVMAEKILVGMSCKKNNRKFNQYWTEYDKYKEERLNSALIFNEKNRQPRQVESFEQILRIANIIAKHSDQEITKDTQKLVNTLGPDFGKLLAAIEIGDKFDLRATRTRKNGYDNDYKRVNQCIKHSIISVNRRKIKLDLITDEQMIKNIYGNEEEFIKALLRTDGNKLIHCNRLALRFLQHNVLVELNGNVVDIPKLFEKYKPTTGDYTK
jgi:hypothetical protein